MSRSETQLLSLVRLFSCPGSVLANTHTPINYEKTCNIATQFESTITRLGPDDEMGISGIKNTKTNKLTRLH